MPPDDLAQLVHGSPNAIITADRQGNITSWNHGAQQVFGYSSEEALGMNVRNFALPSEADHQARNYEILLGGGSLPPMEVVRLRKDGSHVHLTVTLWPLRGPDQEIRGIIMIGMDITERKQAEAAQAEMNERFQVLADNIDQLVWIASVDGKDWWFNKRWIEFTGMPADQILARSQAELHHPDHYERVARTLGEAGQKGEAWEEVFPLRRHDGEWRWFLSRAIPIKNVQGVVTKWFGTSTDITDHRKVQDGLKKSEELFHSLANNIDQLVNTYDPLTGEYWFNERWYEYTGLPHDCSVSEFEKRNHPDHIERIRADLKLSRDRGEVWQGTFPIQRADGGYRWFLARSRPLQDDAGNIVKWYTSCTDVHEQRQAADNLRASEERLRVSLKENKELMAAMDEHAIVAITDKKGRIIYVNDKFCSISKYSREELMGQDHRLINSGHHSKEFIKELWDTITSGRVWNGQLRNRAKDGSLYWVDTTIVPFLDDQGKPRQYVAIRTDITEHRRIQELLEKEGRNKDQFLATLAHELRNPLAPLRNGIQILEFAEHDEQMARNTREMMERQMAHLVRLVDDLLDVSRISRGRIELRRGPTDLRPVIWMAVESIDPQISAKQQHLVVDLPDTPVLVDGDSTRLSQIIGNLLSNANRYTAEGGSISLSLIVENGSARVIVSDDGIGMDPARIPEAFEMFSQLGRNGSAHHASGLGIGLNIVKQLVALHGGDVEAHSEGPGKGSTFHVHLPLVGFGEMAH